jgi:hypothetical protein
VREGGIQTGEFIQKNLVAIGHLLLEIGFEDQAAGLLGDIVATIAADSPELIFI